MCIRDRDASNDYELWTLVELPTITLTLSPASVLEDGSENLIYTFSRTGPTGSALTVNFATLASTAAFNGDYQQSGATSFTPLAGTITFAAGSPTATLTIDPRSDIFPETDKTVSIQLSASSTGDYIVGTTAPVVGTIANDDVADPLNQAPTTVSLANVTSNLTENTSTVSRIKVADIVISDDGRGFNAMWLSGSDAAFFEVIGTALYLRAGVPLDYETKANYNIAILVGDPTVVGSTPVTTTYSLAVSGAYQVNQAPTAVSLANVTHTLAENTSTASRIKVADIVIGDDALGSNTISLSGADAAAFEVEGTALYLKDGVTLDYETKASYALTVSVIDASLPDSVPVTTIYSLVVSNVNEAPSASNTSRTLAEDTPVVLTAVDFGTFSDVDGDLLSAVQITSLPTVGLLEFNTGLSWQSVVLNQQISSADLAAGNLRYQPAANAAGNPYTTIGYKVSDGTALSDSSYSLTFTVTPVNDGPAVFVISGSAAVGQTLTATLLTADPDGNGTGGFSYQWQSSADGSSWAAVGGNSASYSVSAADQGKQLRLQVTVHGGVPRRCRALPS